MKGQSLSREAVSNIIDYSVLNYLEIGCYDGVHLVEIAKKKSDKTIFGIDPFIADSHLGFKEGESLVTQKNNLYENINDISNIVFFEGTTEYFYNKFNKNDLNKLNIDFIYIDGYHRYDYIMIDIKFALECIVNNSNKKGIILFDDLHIKDVEDSMNYLENLCKAQGIQYIRKLDYFIVQF